MDDGADFEDRLAARLLGVPVEADAAAIRGRFRSLVKAVHPDRTVMDACIDIGTLAEAKDRLLRRAGARTARDAAARADREEEARRRLDAMRPRPGTACAGDIADLDEAPVQGQSFVSTGWAPKSSVMTARFEPVAKVGVLVDLAG